MTMIRPAETRLIGLATLVVASAIGFLASATCASDDRGSSPNVALGKQYTLTPEPNYPLCTEAGDAQQLTDGSTVDTSKQQLWINQGCVGWKTLAPVEVVIDLEKVQPIASVVLFSGAGPNAEVYLPSVVVAVSDNGDDFRVVRRIDNARATQLARATLRADRLNTRGRYVLVRLDPPYGSYAFVDEVQVFRGEHDPKAVRLPEQTLPRLQPDTRTEHQKRLMRALDRWQRRAKQVGSAESSQRFADVRDTIAQAPSVAKGKARVMDSGIVSALNDKATALFDHVIRDMHRRDRLAVWDISPWAEVLPREIPLTEEAELTELRVVAGQNEYESQAFLVTNFSNQPRSLKVELLGPLSRSDEWGGHIKLRHAVFVETPEGFTLADALPLLDRPLVLPPWQSRQVWLEIHTGEAAAGTHRGTIFLKGDAGEHHRVALTVDVVSVRMPDDPPVATYSWQYVDSIATLKGIEEEAVADLAAHYTNVNILSKNMWSWPRKENDEVDERGNLAKDPDFGSLDKWLQLCRPISSKGTTWFPSLPYRKEFQNDAPEYRTYAQWIRRWVAHLKELGLGYEDFFVYPIDENIRTDFINSGRAIRSVDPNIRIFADPMMRDEDRYLKAAAPYVDIWCPALEGKHPHQVNLLQNTGKPVWCYTVGRRMRHPYSLYRLALWKAFRMGATGCGFWCYAVGKDWKNADMWRESAMLYAAIYTLEGAPEDISREEAIIPSKRWEAWREGIEDYTYLYMLRELIERAPPSDRAVEAQQTLDAAVQRVLDEPENLQLANRHRHKVLKAIMALQAATADPSVERLRDGHRSRQPERSTK